MKLTSLLLVATLLAGAVTAQACDQMTSYTLVFAINGSPGVLGYSQASVTTCAGGLSEAEIASYRKAVADHHRKKSPELTDDQVVLLNMFPMRSDTRKAARPPALIL